MIRALYSSVMWLAQPFLRAKLKRRASTEPGYGIQVEERFGCYSFPAAPPGELVWVHAVSLGETRAAAQLVSRLRLRLPGMRLLLTHGTATGREEGARLLQAGDVQVWQPWDSAGAVSRFLTHFQPRIGILIETEVWPNLAFGCAKAKVPLVLANARLSEKSLHQSLRLAYLAKPAYLALQGIWAQTDADARRIEQLGGHVTGVFGNLKFDATPDAGLLVQGRQWRQARTRPVVMFASSREGEEALFLKLLEEKSAKVPVSAKQLDIKNIAFDIQWLIVPRHPQRFDEVAALVAQHGFKLSRRSAWRDGPPDDATAAPTLWLGDSLGEMAIYFGLADVVLLGGSFEKLGGQNLIEAAACGCPVVMGPHTFNFVEAAELARAAGAALRVASLDEGIDQAVALVNDASALATARRSALEFAAAHQGATDQLVDAIAAMLGVKNLSSPI